jgi:hypothetical protein
MLCRLRNEHPALRRSLWLGSADGRVRPDGMRYFNSRAREIPAGEAVDVHGPIEILIPGRDRSVFDRRSQWTGDAEFLLLCNPRDSDAVFSIPSDGGSRSWWRAVDTGRAFQPDVSLPRVSGVFTVRAHSMVVLMGTPAR